MELYTYIAVVLLLLFLYKFVIVPVRTFAYYRRKDVPVEAGLNPVLGSTLKIKQLIEQNKAYLNYIVLQPFLKNPHQGMVYQYNMFGSGVMVGDPVLVQELFQQMGHAIDKKDCITKIAASGFTEAYFHLETNAACKKRREATQPAFSHTNLKVYTDIFKVVIEKWMKKNKDLNKSKLLMSTELSEMTLEVIGIAAFGSDFSSVKIDYSINSVVQKVTLQDALDDSFGKGNAITLRYFFISYLPRFIRESFNTEIKEYYENIKRIVSQVRYIVEARENEWRKSGKQVKYLLDMLLQQKEDGIITIEEVISDAILFIFAGHETSSRALSALLYRISLQPEIQVKMRSEIKKVILGESEDAENMGKHITYENVGNLEYTTMCIKEALRIDPPLSAVICYAAKKDLTLSNGITIFKGMNCYPAMVLLHRNPLIWHSPDEFIPERFDPSSGYFKTPSGEKRHPYSFIPFVAGPRNCVGQNFALLEIKFIVAYLLSNYTFEIEENKEELLFPIPVSVPLHLTVSKLTSQLVS